MNKTRASYNMFPLGRVMQSPQAKGLFKRTGLDPRHFVWRHVTGDWGHMDDFLEKANYDAVRLKLEVRSIFPTHDGTLTLVTNPGRTLTIIDIQ